jgi:hypothetical protein
MKKLAVERGQGAGVISGQTGRRDIGIKKIYDPQEKAATQSPLDSRGLHFNLLFM